MTHKPVLDIGSHLINILKSPELPTKIKATGKNSLEVTVSLQQPDWRKYSTATTDSVSNQCHDDFQNCSLVAAGAAEVLEAVPCEL